MRDSGSLKNRKTECVIWEEGDVVADMEVDG